MLPPARHSERETQALRVRKGAPRQMNNQLPELHRGGRGGPGGAKAGSAACNLLNNAERASGSANAHLSEAALASAASTTRCETFRAKIQQQEEGRRGLATSPASKRCAGSLKTVVG